MAIQIQLRWSELQLPSNQCLTKIVSLSAHRALPCFRNRINRRMHPVRKETDHKKEDGIKDNYSYSIKMAFRQTEDSLLRMSRLKWM